MPRLRTPREPVKTQSGTESSQTLCWREVDSNLRSPRLRGMTGTLAWRPASSVPRLCSAIDPVERLVEHCLVPGIVPRLNIGLDFPEEIGPRSLLGGEALGAELAHLSVETLYVDRARPMILDHDLSPDD